MVEAHAVKCELAAEVLRSSGTLRLRVTGWSMLPTIWPGDTLVVQRARSESITVGDVVLFGRDQRLFVHRAIAVGEDSALLTRGDAMSASDPPLQPHELLGRISGIIRNGELIEPRPRLRAPEMALASLAQKSKIAARVMVGVHGMRQASRTQTS